MAKTIKALTENYMDDYKGSNLFIREKVQNAYTQGCKDALSEISRYCGNVMPPFYKRLLEVKLAKMETEV